MRQWDQYAHRISEVPYDASGSEIGTPAWVGASALCIARSVIFPLFLISRPPAQLRDEFSRFIDQLRGMPSGSVPSEVRTTLIEFMLMSAMECMVDGFTRAKRVRRWWWWWWWWWWRRLTRAGGRRSRRRARR
jgi:hypothetical protein